jgi:hypothetical protein
MKKRLLFLAAAAAACLLAVPYATSAEDPKKPAAGQVIVYGIVKGAPVGKTFVLANKKGTTAVDASAAKIRERGKFTTIAAVKSGTVAQAKGAMVGATLKATDVNLYPKRQGPKQEVPPGK